MPMQAVVQSYGVGNKLTPLYNSISARVKPINLPPNVNYAAGQVLFQATGPTNAVQTITAPGSGTYIISGVNPLTGVTFSTTPLAFGANDAAILAALVAAIGTGSAGLSVASAAVTFAGPYAGRPVPLMTTSAGSIANTTPGVTAGTWTAYTGTGSPSMLLEYPSTTDPAGNINTSLAFTYQSQPFATAFYSGTFSCADLVGLDANAVTKMGGLLVAGTVTNGTFRF